jgi:hypothetical protein
MAKEKIVYVPRTPSTSEDVFQFLGIVLVVVACAALLLSAIAGGMAWFGLGDIDTRLKAVESRPARVVQYYTQCDAKGVCTSYSYINGQWTPSH